jgi:hypothetical protein
MLVTDHPAYVEEVVAFAKSLGLYEPNDARRVDRRCYLKPALDRLESFTRTGADGEITTRVTLYRDSAPHSFGFVVEARNGAGEWHADLVGGLIFHGPHDGGGTGAAPSFSVSFTPCVGWSIHT